MGIKNSHVPGSEFFMLCNPCQKLIFARFSIMTQYVVNPEAQIEKEAFVKKEVKKMYLDIIKTIKGGCGCGISKYSAKAQI